MGHEHGPLVLGDFPTFGSTDQVVIELGLKFGEVHTDLVYVNVSGLRL